MTDIKKLGEMALVLPLAVAYDETSLDAADYFPFEYWDNFHYHTDGAVVYRMNELNDFYSDISVVEFLELIEESDWFTVHDTYYIKESSGMLCSMNVGEAEQYYIDRTDMTAFLQWMQDNDGSEDVTLYLHDMARDLEEQYDINKIIIDLRGRIW